LLWALTDHARLSADARRLLRGSEAVFASAVSMWEFAIKIALGRLRCDLRELIDAAPASGLHTLDIRPQHALAVLNLPALHRDPFDRMLVAQSMSEGMSLLTSDQVLRPYGAHVIVI
jgi:PIN domain nuclease of toxin-antitoxin system